MRESLRRNYRLRSYSNKSSREERECVCVCERERKCVCVKERERECVCVKEREREIKRETLNSKCKLY